MLFSLVFFTFLVSTAHSHTQSAIGQYSLRSGYGTYLRAWQGHNDDQGWHPDFAPHRKLCERWYIEPSNGKVVLRSRCTYVAKRYLADSDKSVELTLWKHEWTPNRCEDGSWTFESEQGRWLSANKNGSISTVKTPGVSEHFWLKAWIESYFDSSSNSAEYQPKPHSHAVRIHFAEDKHSPEHNAAEDETKSVSSEIVGKFSLQSIHDTYLRAWKGVDHDKEWHADFAPHRQRCELWHIEEMTKDTVALRPQCSVEEYHPLYLGVDHIDGLIKLASNWGMPEWTPFKHADGTWSFEHNGLWLSADSNGSAVTEKDKSFSGSFRLKSWTENDHTEEESNSSEDLSTQSSTPSTGDPRTVTIIHPPLRFSHEQGEQGESGKDTKEKSDIAKETTSPSTSTATTNETKTIQHTVSVNTMRRTAVNELTQSAKQEEVHTSSFNFTVVFFAFALLIVLLIIAAIVYSIAPKRKPDIRLSYRNLIYEDAQPYQEPQRHL